MLDIAQKYTEELTRKFIDTTYDEKFKFYHGEYVDKYSPSDSTWSAHEFVSISNGEVIGYITYTIDRNTYSAYRLKIINFSDNKFTFGIDLAKVLDDIFTKYNFEKLSFTCYVGNPAEKGYDKLINRHGGRIVGIKERESKLTDGKFYDLKLYEILRKNYKRR